MDKKEYIPPSTETNNKGKPCYCFQMEGEFMKNPEICKGCGFREDWSNITADGSTIDPTNINRGTTKVDYVGCYKTEINRIASKYDDEKIIEKKIKILNNKIKRHTK